MLKMNLPNKLTLLRLLLVPVFVFFFVKSFDNTDTNTLNAYRIIAGVVFIVASLTDFLDGYLARRDNLVTNFGKLMDPLADKTLVCTALMCLTVYDFIPLWDVLIVVFREFLISGFRLIAVEQNIVISASIYGKYKTATQMVSIILLIFNFHLINKFTYILTYGLFYISLALTIISLIDYIVKNKKVILEGGL